VKINHLKRLKIPSQKNQELRGW